jgi:hypothetical protein
MERVFVASQKFSKANFNEKLGSLQNGPISRLGQNFKRVFVASFSFILAGLEAMCCAGMPTFSDIVSDL